jgi:hypothetical protein
MAKPVPDFVQLQARHANTGAGFCTIDSSMTARQNKDKTRL